MVALVHQVQYLRPVESDGGRTGSKSVTYANDGFAIPCAFKERMMRPVEDASQRRSERVATLTHVWKPNLQPRTSRAVVTLLDGRVLRQMELESFKDLWDDGMGMLMQCRLREVNPGSDKS